MREFEHTGYWWLPTTDDHKVAGTLSYSHQGGLVLKLLGSIKTPDNRDEIPVYPTIFGRLANSSAVTLHLSRQIGIRMSADQVSQELSANIAFIGAHIGNLSDATFCQATMTFSHLVDWEGGHWFVQSPVASTDHRTEQILYTEPLPVTATTTKGEVTVYFGFSQFMWAKRKVTVEQKASISVVAKEAISYQEWHSDFIYPLQNLVSLATDRPNNLTSLKLTIPATPGDTRPKYVDVIYQAYSNPLDDDTAYKPLFKLDDVRECFDDLVERWLKLSEELDDVLSLFFSVMYDPKMVSIHKFLSLAHAAEAYHSRRFKNEVLPNAEYKSRVQLVAEGVPLDLKDWIIEKLNWGNQLTLADRLRDLTETRISVLPASQGDRETFLKSVRYTRNYYTHYSDSLRKKAAKGQELHYLGEDMFTLVQYWLLRELGFEEHVCARLVHGTTRRMMREYNQAWALVEKAQLSKVTVQDDDKE